MPAAGPLSSSCWAANWLNICSSEVWAMEYSWMLSRVLFASTDPNMATVKYNTWNEDCVSSHVSQLLDALKNCSLFWSVTGICQTTCCTTTTSRNVRSIELQDKETYMLGVVSFRLHQWLRLQRALCCSASREEWSRLKKSWEGRLGRVARILGIGRVGCDAIWWWTRSCHIISDDAIVRASIAWHGVK